MSIGITTRMNEVKSDLDSTLLNIYSIDDFDAACEELSKAKPSQKIFLRKKLVNMFKAVGIDVDYDEEYYYYQD